MKKIVFAGGGTAGHVMPNLALIAGLSNDYECIYIGGNGMEKELCASRGISFYEIDTVKLRRGVIVKNLGIPFKLTKCVNTAVDVLRGISPDLIFSKGGYAALPAVLAAKRLGIALLCHESDCSPGLVTKLSRRRAVKILCAFEPCAAKFKNGVFVGSPLRTELYDAKNPAIKAAAAYRFATSATKPTLVIMGGSSGAATLNAIVVQALPELLRTFCVIHITGKGKRTDFSADGYTQLEFCSDMRALYSVADVALSRAGANALAELIALQIPAVAVPLEKASRGDQKENADYYASKNALSVVRESTADAQSLCRAVTNVYNNRIAYKAAMSKLNVDGTSRICDIIKTLLA